jgi:predicted nucleic acid-binding protein
MQSLLDCNILSELRKGARGSAEVRKWFDAQPEEDLFISLITLGELSAGIARIAERDPAQAQHLEAWLERTKRDYADRILPVTAAVADRWGRLCPKQPLPAADGLLAATALEYDLTVATRNVNDFERSGVRLINPFA